MGEDFPVEVCPNCGSTGVITTYDDLGLIRLFLICRACGYLEATNPHVGHSDCEDPPADAWESDPDAWKS